MVCKQTDPRVQLSLMRGGKSVKLGSGVENQFSWGAGKGGPLHTTPTDVVLVPSSQCHAGWGRGEAGSLLARCQGQ